MGVGGILRKEVGSFLKKVYWKLKENYGNFLICLTAVNFVVMIGFTVLLVVLPRQVLFYIPGVGIDVTTALYVYVSAGFFLLVLFPLLVKEFGFPHYVEEKK